MLDGKLLRSFIALTEDPHFGRTSARLGMAQSMLSAQIKRLEDIVGGRLLDRNRRSAVELTYAGKVFLAEARAAVEQLDRAERIAQLALCGSAGPARLGFVFSAAMSGVLSRALSAIREHLPQIDISTALLETPEQIAAICEGRIEAGIIRLGSSFPSDVNLQQVHSEPLVLAISATHPLTSQPRLLSSDLAGHRFIIPRGYADMGLRSAARDLAVQGAFASPDFIQTVDTVSAAAMAAAGYGVVLAPQSLINLQIPDLVYKEIEDYDVPVNLAVAWIGKTSPLVEKLIEGI